MADLQQDNESTLSPTQKVMQYWKGALAALATAGAIATCVYFPPAALFLSPAVEFLVVGMGLTGLWAGFAAFGTVVLGIAALTFGVTRSLLEGIDRLVSHFFSGSSATATAAVSTVSTSDNQNDGDNSAALDINPPSAENDVAPLQRQASGSSSLSEEEDNNAPIIDDLSGELSAAHNSEDVSPTQTQEVSSQPAIHAPLFAGHKRSPSASTPEDEAAAAFTESLVSV